MKDSHGTHYEPWQDGDMIGLKATKLDGSVVFIYFNPSDEDSDGQSNLFVYRGNTGDPNYDNPIIYVMV